jgi:hypothetical protein
MNVFIARHYAEQHSVRSRTNDPILGDYEERLDEKVAKGFCDFGITTSVISDVFMFLMSHLLPPIS